MNDTLRYEQNQSAIEKWYESLCVRCGKCCGAGEVDPCNKLVMAKDGTYKCAKYEGRLGPQETVSGIKFNCVMIREVLKYKEAVPDCAYRRT